jgi:hypothetical protein
MNEHYQKNTKLREENIELANKLKNLIEQYELREEVGFSDGLEIVLDVVLFVCSI